MRQINHQISGFQPLVFQQKSISDDHQMLFSIVPRHVANQVRIRLTAFLKSQTHSTWGEHTWNIEHSEPIFLMVNFNTRIQDILEGFPFNNPQFGMQKNGVTVEWSLLICPGRVWGSDSPLKTPVATRIIALLILKTSTSTLSQPLLPLNYIGRKCPYWYTAIARNIKKTLENWVFGNWVRGLLINHFGVRFDSFLGEIRWKNA